MAISIDLKNKVVLVTGAASGIGAGVARLFARAGAKVAGCDKTPRSGKAASAFTRGLQEAEADHLYIHADITREEEMKKVVMTTVLHFEKIDILVSNAGANFFEGADSCTAEKWEENMKLNLTAHWLLAKLCKPYLDKADPGVIILVTSSHAFSTIPGCFPYNVAKTAMTGLVRSLAIEWGPGIRTVGIAPGFIDTPGNQKWFDAFPDPVAERNRTIALHPVRQLGTPEEIGAWCVFLASDHAAFASGVTYLVDGGRSALMQDS